MKNSGYFSSRESRKSIMKPFVLVCASVITWAYVVEAQWDKNEELQAHEGSVIGCNGRRMQLNKLMKEVECVPRYTLVKLVPQPGYTFYPDYIPVMRCSGYCPKNKSCMPVVKKAKKIAVRMNGYYTSECYHVLTEEHLRCKCQCSVMESDCNSHQVYSRDNCACQCKNREICDKARKMLWNEKMCKCVCNKPEEACSSGLEWVPSLCGCAKVMEMPARIDIRK